MSIFDFFRHKKKIEEPVQKKHNLENLPSLIEGETKNINDKSEKLKNELNERVNQISSELKQKIPGLKMINLNKRKGEDRLKEIVMTSLSDYIIYLGRLIKDLEKIEPKEIEQYIKEIQLTFNNFNKNSKMIYERATILIGKELAEVRNIIDTFAKDFNEKLISNKETFERIHLIKAIKDNLKEFEESKILQKQIEDSVSDFKEKIAKIEKEKQLFEKNYEEYKKSNESREFIEEQEKIKQENKIINEEIIKLKRDINFKDLAKYYHENRKKSKIIKDYSEDFLNSLKQDSDFSIISLLKEANQSIDEEKIKELSQKILSQKILSSDNKLKEFEGYIIKVDHGLKYENEELEHENIKKQRFEENQNQILEKIKEESKKIWPEIEF
jgi:hypothetical protein